MKAEEAWNAHILYIAVTLCAAIAFWSYNNLLPYSLGDSCMQDPYPVEIRRTLYPLWGAVAASFVSTCFRASMANFGLGDGNGRHLGAIRMSVVIITAQFLAISSATFGIGDHTCVDFLNVPLSFATWMEWLTTVPLQFFLVSALDMYKTSFEFNELLPQTFAGLSLLCYFLVNFDSIPLIFCYILFCLAQVLMILALGWQQIDALEGWVTASEICKKIPRNDELEVWNKDKFDALKIARSKLNCSSFMCIFFTLIPLVYYLHLSRYIDLSTYWTMVHWCGYLAKALQMQILTDCHVEILDPSKFQIIEERKRSDESRVMFLRYVFHEVRVPLNSVSLGLQLLFDNPNLDDADRETLHIMRDATNFMAETLNDVLSLQKIEQGMMELEEEYFSPDQLVGTVVANFSTQFLAKGINVHVEVRENVPKQIIGDRFRLEHVLGNLVSNAIKFSDPGSNISISLTFGTKQPNHVTFAVRDQGPGMTPDEQKALFKPFMQIRPGELQKGRGSGLGLSICKTIIALHNGSVGCVSKQREGADVTTGGSEFFFSIECASQKSDKMKAASDPSSEIRPLLAGETVIPSERRDILRPGTPRNTTAAAAAAVNRGANPVVTEAAAGPFAMMLGSLSGDEVPEIYGVRIDRKRSNSVIKSHPSSTGSSSTSRSNGALTERSRSSINSNRSSTNTSLKTVTSGSDTVASATTATGDGTNPATAAEVEAVPVEVVEAAAAGAAAGAAAVGGGGGGGGERVTGRTGTGGSLDSGQMSDLPSHDSLVSLSSEATMTEPSPELVDSTAVAPNGEDLAVPTVDEDMGALPLSSSSSAAAAAAAATRPSSVDIQSSTTPVKSNGFVSENLTPRSLRQIEILTAMEDQKLEQQQQQQQLQQQVDPWHPRARALELEVKGDKEEEEEEEEEETDPDVLALPSIPSLAAQLDLWLPKTPSKSAQLDLQRAVVSCSDLFATEEEEEEEETGKAAAAVTTAGAGDSISSSSTKSAGLPSVGRIEVEEVVSQAADSSPTGSGAVRLLRAAINRLTKEFEAAVKEERNAVKKLGGLYVIGTSKHESRRVDNQLRGRAGRQGDMGASRFFLSLEDDIFRLFGADKLAGMMDNFRVAEDMPIESELVGTALDKVQGQVEDYFRGTRAQVFRLDEVASYQRNVVYSQRRAFLTSTDEGMLTTFTNYCMQTMEEIYGAALVGQKGKPGSPGGPVNAEKLHAKARQFFPNLQLTVEDISSTAPAEVLELLKSRLDVAIQEKRKEVDTVSAWAFVAFFRYLALVQVDESWCKQLTRLDLLKEEMVLQSFTAEKDVMETYRENAMELFSSLMDDVRRNTVYSLFIYNPTAGK